MRASASLSLLLMVALAGYASPPPRPAQPSVNLSGYSAAFKTGYADGCESAQGAGLNRDDSRFKADADYATGWQDGNSVCRRKKSRVSP